MKNVKLEHKRGSISLKIKGAKGQQLCEREMHAIYEGQMAGLIPMTAEQRGAAYHLHYDLTPYIPLPEYLAAPMGKGLFAAVLEQILRQLQTMDIAVFNAESLFLDPEYVFVTPDSRDLMFVYVPLYGFQCGTQLRQLLLDLVQLCNFDPNEDLSFVKTYIELLNRGAAFSVYELEEYVSELKAGLARMAPAKKCPHCGMAAGAEFGFCPECGTPLAEEQEQKQQTPAGAFLFRESTGDRIRIDRDEFRIGKSMAGNDYSLPELRTVSRHHAAILCRTGRYSIRDLGSTNGTFVAGREVSPDEEAELTDGCRILLANEAFIFEIR